MHNALIEYSDLISLLTAVGTFVAIVAGVVELVKARREHVKAKEQEFNSSYLASAMPITGCWSWRSNIPSSASSPGRKSRSTFRSQISAGATFSTR